MRTTTTRYRFEIMVPTQAEHDRWKQAAADRNMYLSALVRAAVDQYLERQAQEQANKEN